MNGLEALEEIKRDMEYVTRLDYVEPIVRGEVRDNLSKIYHRELPQLDQIEKELKVLEIIKKDPQRALLISNYKDYNEYINDKDPYYIEKELMDKDEFDLLKEVLK